MELPAVHPAKGVMAMRRITVRDAANEIGVNYAYLSKILLGYLPASARVRAGLCELLGLPETELFAGLEPDSESAPVLTGTAG